MNTLVNIALLHLIILSAQVFYMYFSNKAQMKKHLYLYALAIPVVMAFPVILSKQDIQAYCLYEYAIIFCIFTAEVVDITLAGAFDKEYLSDETLRRFSYSFFMICIATTFCGNISLSVRGITAAIFIGLFAFLNLIKKHSFMELVKSIPLALFSIICSWVFCRL